MNKRFNFLRNVLAAFFIMMSMVAVSQTPPSGPPPGGGGTTGTDPPCWEPECIPIDGGIGLLIAAGAVIGVRKLYGQSK